MAEMRTNYFDMLTHEIPKNTILIVRNFHS